MFLLENIALFIPELALSVVNIVVTSILASLVQFEKWDYASTSIMNEIARVYIAQFVDFITFMLIQIEVLTK